MSKKSFILYLDQQDLFNKLPDDIAGKLIKHIFSYVNCENPKTDELIIDVAFASIKQALKRDLEKWSGKQLQWSEAGKKSAEKRANEKQRKATTVEARSTNPTVSVNGSVSVNVSESVSVKPLKDLVPKQLGTESIFEEVWKQFPTKQNKKKAMASFESYLNKNKKVDPIAFGKQLHDDICKRCELEQFGFDKLHFTTYMNGERFNDDYSAEQNSHAMIEQYVAGLDFSDVPE